MKKGKLILILAVSLGIYSCDVLTAVADTAINSTTGTTSNALTNDEVIAGLKEALTVGIQNGAGLASKEDGFFKNDLIKLPFPPDVIKVKEKLMADPTGLGKKKVEEFELGMNRAAELASKEAAPIFIDAIKSMTIADGFTILKGEDNAATNYLRDKTTTKLTEKFSPIVQNAIEQAKVMSLWEKVTTAYNASTFLTGKEEVNTDLNGYITGKAISGLFMLVENEEKKIRLDPIARVSDVLKKVFGSLDK
ncbi:MAG: DUF4197 domain-containing protein [Flavobacteriales bacterium]|nr:DUF4197 domain-containing protein [Flavobacteriales bacterium]